MPLSRPSQQRWAAAVCPAGKPAYQPSFFALLSFLFALLALLFLETLCQGVLLPGPRNQHTSQDVLHELAC